MHCSFDFFLFSNWKRKSPHLPGVFAAKNKLVRVSVPNTVVERQRLQLLPHLNEQHLCFTFRVLCARERRHQSFVRTAIYLETNKSLIQKKKTAVFGAWQCISFDIFFGSLLQYPISVRTQADRAGRPYDFEGQYFQPVQSFCWETVLAACCQSQTSRANACSGSEVIGMILSIRKKDSKNFYWNFLFLTLSVSSRKLHTIAMSEVPFKWDDFRSEKTKSQQNTSWPMPELAPSCI